MPYSLLGLWHGGFTPVSDPNFSFCYTELEVNLTNIVWTMICDNNNSTTNSSSVLARAVISSPSVAACGQNQQLGLSYGVFGGIMKIQNASKQTTPICIYYSRVDPEHLNVNAFNAQSQFMSWVPKPEDDVSDDENVGCTVTPPPTEMQLPSPNLGLLATNGTFICASGVCQSNPRSSTCIPVTPLHDVAVGLSVGGIGVMVITAAIIFLTSRWL